MQTTLAYSHGGERGRLGAYRLGRLLSETYFGARFAAQSDAAGPDCSLTVIELHDDALAQRLARAAAWATQLDHPSLSPVRETVVIGTTLVCASQLHEGATLRQLLDTLVNDGESIPTDIIVRIALDVLEGLAALQRLVPANDGSASPRIYGMVHPDNIHVGTDGRTRLIDAPLAATAACEPRWSESTARIAYAPPEHCEAARQLDVRADVFSLGTVLWELVACRPLFDAADPHTLRNELLHTPIPRVFRDRFVRGEPISAALADLTARALQREPGRRFASFDEMSEALRQSRDVAERADVGALVQRVLLALERNRQDPSSLVTVPPPDQTDVFDSPTRPLRALTPTDPAPAPDRVTSPDPVGAAAPQTGHKPAALPPPPPAAALSGAPSARTDKPIAAPSPIPPAGALSSAPPAPRLKSPLPSPIPPAGALSARPPTAAANGPGLDGRKGTATSPLTASVATAALSDDFENHTAPPVSDIADEIVVPGRRRLPLAVLVGGGIAVLLLLLTLMTSGSRDKQAQPEPSKKPVATATKRTEPEPKPKPKPTVEATAEPTRPSTATTPSAPTPPPSPPDTDTTAADKRQAERAAPVRRPVRRKRQNDAVYIPDDI